MPPPTMNTTIAITRQKSVGWLRQALSSVPGPITSGTTQINSFDTEIKFPFIANEGPSWPAPAGGGGSEEFVETNAANGVLVQYPKETKVLDGRTGTPKSSAAASGESAKLRFTNLSNGADVLKALVALQGTIVQACIPIGENETTAQEGYLYLVGMYSSAIEYDAGGEEVVAIDIEISGTSTTPTVGATDAIYAWAPDGIIPLHDSSGEPEVTPTACVAGDAPTLKAGTILIK